MPNPKSGTVTNDVAKAVKEVKQGKIDFKVDKAGIIHSSIGKASFSADQIFENAQEFINMLIKLKPSSSKGAYIQSVSLSSTMSPGIKVDLIFKVRNYEEKEKGAIIDRIAETLEQYDHFYITNTEGLNAADTADLRRACFKAGIKLVVVKNTLLRKALDKKGGDYSELVPSFGRQHSGYVHCSWQCASKGYQGFQQEEQGRQARIEGCLC